MAIIDKIPGFSVDIRSTIDDETAFIEYNPGEEKQQEWPSDVDPALAGGPEDGDVETLYAESAGIIAAQQELYDEDYIGPSTKGTKRGAAGRKQPKRKPVGRQAAASRVTKSTTAKPCGRKRKTAEVDLDSICTRYIETSSQGYQICFTWFFDFVYKEYDIQADIIIDGKLVEDRLFTREQLMTDEGPDGWSHLVDGASRIRDKPGGLGGKEWVQKGFSFGRLDIDEDFRGTVPQSMKNAMKEVGKITVKLWRVEIGKQQKGNNKPWQDLKAHVGVPEKAVKGGAVSLETSFSTVRPIKELAVNETEPVDDWDKPFATFNFCYRTLKDLEALHIIARAKPLEEKPDEELTPEDLRVMAMRWRLEQKKKNKRERMIVKQEYNNLLPFIPTDYSDDEEIQFLGTSKRSIEQNKSKDTGPVVLENDDDDDDDDERVVIYDRKPPPGSRPDAGPAAGVDTPLQTFLSNSSHALSTRHSLRYESAAQTAGTNYDDGYHALLQAKQPRPRPVSGNAGQSSNAVWPDKGHPGINGGPTPDGRSSRPTVDYGAPMAIMGKRKHNIMFEEDEEEDARFEADGAMLGKHGKSQGRPQAI